MERMGTGDDEQKGSSTTTFYVGKEKRRAILVGRMDDGSFYHPYMACDREKIP